MFSVWSSIHSLNQCKSRLFWASCHAAEHCGHNEQSRETFLIQAIHLSWLQCTRMRGMPFTQSLPHKTVSACFSIRWNGFYLTTDQKTIGKVNEFRCLGVILDFQLKFHAHIRKASKTGCFWLIRSCSHIKAAQIYMYALVLLHLSY